MPKDTHAHTQQESIPNDFEVDFSNLDEVNKAADIFKHYGFVVLRNSIPIEIIRKVHCDLKIAVSKRKITNTQRDLHLFKDGSISSAHNLINYIPSYKALANIFKIKMFAEKIFGHISNESFNSSYFAKPKKQAVETKPHQDNAFFCMEPADVATCWIPITFANKANGCVYYYPRSHTLGNLVHSPEGNLGASMSIPQNIIADVAKKYNREYTELNSGDCVIHNALIVHGSEPNYSEFDRNAFNFSIARLSAKRNYALYEKYQESLSLFLNRQKEI